VNPTDKVRMKVIIHLPQLKFQLLYSFYRQLYQQ